MVHELEAGPLGHDLAGFVGRAAVGLAASIAVLLGLALLTEVLRRRHRALRLLALLDAAVPGGARTAAVSLLAIAATFAGARPAAAEDSVRGWLGRPTTSTSQPARVATPDAVDELVDPAPRPTITGPVVLVPPAVEERPTPGAPPPVAPAAPTPPVTAAPAPVLPTYVVQPGDCLWAIAARILGPRADGRTIDAGWRRLYDTNRAAVGDNPNLIHIGLVLRLPPLDAQL
jgi:nucleoid-associated protein YgaU